MGSGASQGRQQLRIRSARAEQEAWEQHQQRLRLEQRLAELRKAWQEGAAKRIMPHPEYAYLHEPMAIPARGLKYQLWIKQEGRCAYCHGDLLPRYHLDHIHPRAKYGTNHPSNLCLACQPCNIMKRDRELHDFLAYLKRKQGS